MNKTKYPSYPTISLIKIQKQNYIRPVECFSVACTHTLSKWLPVWLYYKVVFLDFCLEYKHNNGMTFSPVLELKNGFCLPLVCSGNGLEIW
jgi:hypothetical protein